jgi:phosphoribosylglycinamide formyltransferase-1
MKNIAILISGRGSNMAALAESIKDNIITNARIVAVISNNPKAAGIEKAKELGLNTIIINSKEYKDKNLYEEKLIETLKNLDIDLICLAGYMKIVGSKIIKSFHNKIINIHPALLPSFPGLDAQKQALGYGVKVTGCTVHFVDEGMDTGPIILQKSVKIKENDTVESLSNRILEKEHILYSEAVNLFVNDKLEIHGRKVFIKGE